jgi:carbon starvation protein CstA
MITFFVSVVLLLGAYHLYGSFLDRVLGIDPHRPMPCQTKFDGVDFVPLPWWRVYLIQLLNIAGLGPVFGAIMGALWGPVVFLWIVLGGIFAGAVHDYVAACISIREGGLSLTGIIEKYLGRPVLRVMLVLTLVLLVMVGVLFVMGPARILADLCATGHLGSAAVLTPEAAETPGAGSASPATTTAASSAAGPAGSPGAGSAASPATATAASEAGPFYTQALFWGALIFVYYFAATLLPIDALIGRIYPFFGASLLVMVAMIIWEIVTGRLVIPELTLANLHPAGAPIWPMMMVTVACGAISGFHATQSPMMARTIESEGYADRVFYGAMLTESLIALVWAAAAIGLFHGDTALLKAALGPKNEAVLVVKQVGALLGPTGFVLILLGVVALPVTTGDTAFRSARLILADLLAIDQRSAGKRLAIMAPLFGIALWLTTTNFATIWTYFAWMNQTLSVFTLWACTVYLRHHGRNHYVTMIPAIFMTMVVTSYILIDAKAGFGASPWLGTILSLIAAAICLSQALRRSIHEETGPAPAPAAS